MDPPNGVLVLSATPRSIEARPPGSLLFYPVLPGGEGEGAAPFAEGEDLEYRRTDPAAAVGAFRLLAKSPDPEVRVGALLRLGRNLRKTGRNQEALQVYGELLRLGPLRVLGLPSELLAREARCTVLERMGRSQELRREASDMYSALYSGRWNLLRPAWEFHVEEARRWLENGPLKEHDRQLLALSKATEWIYGEWLEVRGSKGRRLLRIEDRPVLVSWANSPDRLAAVIAGPGYLDSMWQATLQGRRIKGAWVDADGQLMLGSLDRASRQAVRAAAVTGLPWTLHVTSDDQGAELSAFAVRRRLFLLGFASWHSHSWPAPISSCARSIANVPWAGCSPSSCRR
jgi:hypothetical protein